MAENASIGSVKRLLFGFVAGFLATLVFFEGMRLTDHARQVIAKALLQ
jgi:hypothetical protein